MVLWQHFWSALRIIFPARTGSFHAMRRMMFTKPSVTMGTHPFSKLLLCNTLQGVLFATINAADASGNLCLSRSTLVKMLPHIR